MKARNAVLTLSIALAGCAGGATRMQDGCDIANRYVEAGNAGNAALIAPWMAEDASAVFLSAEDSPHSELQGREAVLEAVETYTAQCPSCRSTLRCLHVTADGVYAIEDVVFTDQDGVERRQSAPLVITFDDGHVKTIVYYPEYTRAESGGSAGESATAN